MKMKKSICIIIAVILISSITVNNSYALGNVSGIELGSDDGVLEFLVIV